MSQLTNLRVKRLDDHYVVEADLGMTKVYLFFDFEKKPIRGQHAGMQQHLAAKVWEMLPDAQILEMTEDEFKSREFKMSQDKFFGIAECCGVEAVVAPIFVGNEKLVGFEGECHACGESVHLIVNPEDEA